MSGHVIRVNTIPKGGVDQTMAFGDYHREDSLLEYVKEVFHCLLRALVAIAGHAILASFFIFCLYLLEMEIKRLFPAEHEIVLFDRLPLRYVLGLGDLITILMLVGFSAVELYKAFSTPRKLPKSTQAFRPSPEPLRPSRVEPRLRQ